MIWEIYGHFELSFYTKEQATSFSEHFFNSCRQLVIVEPKKLLVGGSLEYILNLNFTSFLGLGEHLRQIALPSMSD